MQTLILNGSPRKNGDTAGLIDLVTKQLTGSYKIIDAYKCNCSPCIDCRYCQTHSGCSIKDEMQEVYHDIESCDNILIASPLFFAELSGKLLCLASRFQTYYCSVHFRKEGLTFKSKKGAVILVGGGDGKVDKAFETARIILHHVNVKEIYPLVCSHNTDRVPAVQDPNAVSGAAKIAEYFNG